MAVLMFIVALGAVELAGRAWAGVGVGVDVWCCGQGPAIPVAGLLSSPQPTALTQVPLSLDWS